MINYGRINTGRLISEGFNLFSNSSKDKFRILTYHSIGDDVPKDYKGIYNLKKNKFYDQMSYLKDTDFEIGHLGDFNSISITFDDGFLNNLSVALPILENFNFPFTVFITPGFVENSYNNLYLNKSQLLELASYKNVTIGAHGFSHKPLGLLNTESALEEISDSKKWLEDLISKEVIHFSFPHGNYSDETLTLVKNCLFESACTVNFGSNANGCSLFELKRTDIFSFDTLRDFKLKINGAWDWLEIRTKRHKVWN
jgi:peptidoglycan/xylan/chitin deacetylase (PgdA/CDA1 family)